MTCAPAETMDKRLAPTDRERFATLKDEARGNTERIDPMGVELQAHTLRLFVQPGLDQLAADGEPDTRCSTCAFRAGTVPGGCMQTQADALKAIMEDVPFMCHAHEVNGRFDRLCHGWFAARVHMGDKTIPAPWPWVEDLEKQQRERADKRLATLQAQAALRGITVDRDGSDGFVVRMQGQPWERQAGDLEALGSLLGRMGVKT
jgi:hypothetical protein